MGGTGVTGGTGGTGQGRGRWLALLGSSVVAVGILAVAWPRLARRPGPGVRLHEVSGLPPRAPNVLGEEENPTTPERWRYFLTPEQADHCYDFLGDPRRAYDPWVYCRDAGNLNDRFPRPEHPNRHWWWRTNSLGLREDHELDDPPRDLRVLVAGDSHTFGLCDNSETFANLLEGRLARLHPGRTVEVLNAGYGGYTFHQYLGTILRLRSFAPQVCVVTVFGGNDFVELVVLESQFAGRPLPPMSAEFHARRAKALACSADAMGQGLNSADSFRAWPEEEPKMVAAAIARCVEMRRVAEANGSRLIIAFLPSPFDFDWPKQPKYALDARAALGLTDAELAVNRRMGEGLLAGLREAGVTVLDLRPVLERESPPPYWRLDFHLDLRGHARVAEALEPLVEAELSRR